MLWKEKTCCEKHPQFGRNTPTNKYPDPKLREDVTTQLVKTKNQEIKYYHKDVKNHSEIENNTNVWCLKGKTRKPGILL